MNMIRNLLTVFFAALGTGLFLSDATTWRWADPGGATVVNTLIVLNEFKPFSFLLCFVIAIGLFLTRKQY